MKNALLVLFAWVSFNGLAQTYHPMLDSLAWTTEYNSFTGTSFTWSVPQGYTTINGNQYTVYPNAILREDTVQRKVYRWNSQTASDDLLYDFTLNIGDTLHIHTGTYIGDMTVTGKDSVLTLAGYRKRWFLQDVLMSSIWVYIVEGIGSLTDPIRMVCQPTIDPQWHGTCFYHHGVKMYGSLCPNYLTNYQLFINPATCGQCNGSITAFTAFLPDTLAWSTPPYNFSMNGPATIGSLCAQTTGTVTVTQTSTGFSQTDFYVVPGSAAPVLQNTATVPASCSTCCDGSITETATSGAPPYNYSWSPNVSTSSTATGLCPGSYIVTVTDSSGCTSSDTLVISFTTAINSPNTATDIFIPGILSAGQELTITGLPSRSRLKIFDALGRNVFSSENYDGNFSAAAVPAGNYVVCIILPNGNEYRKKLCVIK